MLGSLTAALRWQSLLSLTRGFLDQGAGEAELWQERWQLLPRGERREIIRPGNWFAFYFFIGSSDYGWEKTQKKVVLQDQG